MAACVLLLETALTDDTFSEHERLHILQVLRERFGLEEADAEALLAEAAEERNASADLWRFTRMVNESFDVQEKIGIIEEIWRLVYADGELSSHEDYLLRKFRELLHLTHRQVIDAKMRVREELGLG
jgi:uncharacterized tellurite resistance protein B-like protein